LIRTTPQVSYVEYCQAIADIKAQIKEGNTYQVNYTFDVLVRAGCSPEVLYFYLRQFQQTPYCAFVKNIYGHVLSFSPELFFERQGQKILAMPMKGTAARGGTQEEDTRSREGLKTDTKNRAENLMIVDLLRNDLGRIAVAGSVAAPSLFDVETHPTLHQMTSLVQADLLAGITYPEMFRALFPCGSVTGAPKIRTMEIIQQVEKGGRGVYCGALGYISPEKRAVFSVPIRILQQSRGQRHWQYRVGSGIVWDSSTRGEWEEARVKMAFFATQSLPDFDLLETMLWDGRKIAFEKKHIARLLCSAKALKFCATRGGVNKFFIQMKSQLPAGQRVMLRLLLSKKGKLRVEKFSLTPSSGDPVAAISDTVLDSENALLQYKTTYRPWYDAAMARIKRGEIWDDIFLNQRGEVCEGARSNIFIEKGGKLYTPPAASGLLPGILRADLLENGKCAEKILMLSDLKSADAVYCGNSVRGLTRVRVL
jgi:para-aminobenzoate synthetase/4-amino-4-deoxychorismate lyase